MCRLVHMGDIHATKDNIARAYTVMMIIIFGFWKILPKSS